MHKVAIARFLFFVFSQPLFVHGWTWAFLLYIHRLCGVVEGEIEPFSAHAGSGLAQDGLAECDQPGEIPWNTSPRLRIEPGPRGGQTVSYHDCLARYTLQNSVSYPPLLLSLPCQYFSFRVWESYRVGYLFFTSYDLAWNTTYGLVPALHVWGQSTEISLRITHRNSASLIEKGEADL